MKTIDYKSYILENFIYHRDGTLERTDRKGGNGSYDKDGYLIIKIKGKQFKAHRIVWLLNYGEFPSTELDHINRIRTDNRIENLRESYRGEQCENRTSKPNKDTGVIGIYYDRTPGLTKHYAFHFEGESFRFRTLEEALNTKNKLRTQRKLKEKLMATTEKSNVYSKLLKIQTELNAPKNAFNKFGGYSYRSCESILEATKPFLKAQKAVLVVSDDLELIGDRYYIKAVARFIDVETGDSIENSAYAREPIDVKGMSPAQITGACSSYARKYALGGLFVLDDNKDPDEPEYQEQQNNAPAQEPKKKTTKKTEEQLNEEMKASVDQRLVPTADNKMSQEQYEYLMAEIQRTGSMDDVIRYAKTNELQTLTSSKCIAVLTGLLKRPTKTA